MPELASRSPGRAECSDGTCRRLGKVWPGGRRSTCRREPRRHAYARCCLPYVKREDVRGLPAIRKVCADNSAFEAFYDTQRSLLSRLTSEVNLQAAHTTVSQDGMSTYTSENGSVAAILQVAQGERVVWAVASAYALAAIGGGSLRINLFPDQTTSIPKLDLELFTYFGQIHMYLNLAARANLLLDSTYADLYYRQACGERVPSWHALYLRCKANPALTPFQSEALDIRILAGHTALFYSAEATTSNVNFYTQLAQDAVTVWLGLRGCEPGSVSLPESHRLADYDNMYLKYCYRDPDNQKVSSVLGEDVLQEILRLSSRSPDILTI